MDTKTDLDKELTTAEVAELFDVTTSTVHGWRSSGHIKDKGLRQSENGGRSSRVYRLGDLVKAAEKAPLDFYYSAIAIKLGLVQEIEQPDAYEPEHYDGAPVRQLPGLAAISLQIGEIAQVVDRHGTVMVCTDDYKATLVFDGDETLVSYKLDLVNGSSLG